MIHRVETITLDARQKGRVLRVNTVSTKTWVEQQDRDRTECIKLRQGWVKDKSTRSTYSGVRGLKEGVESKRD